MSGRKLNELYSKYEMPHSRTQWALVAPYSTSGPAHKPKRDAYGLVMKLPHHASAPVGASTRRRGNNIACTAGKKFLCPNYKTESSNFLNIPRKLCWNLVTKSFRNVYNAIPKVLEVVSFITKL
eukprot:sb/3475719/